MSLIGRLLVLGPLALVKDMNTQRLYHARDMCLERQLKEDPKAPVLGYYKDPMYIEPHIEMGGRDGRKVCWKGGDGHTYVVAVDQCYDAATLRPVH